MIIITIIPYPLSLPYFTNFTDTSNRNFKRYTFNLSDYIRYRNNNTNSFSRINYIFIYE